MEQIDANQVENRTKMMQIGVEIAPNDANLPWLWIMVSPNNVRLFGQVKLYLKGLTYQCKNNSFNVKLQQDFNLWKSELEGPRGGPKKFWVQVLVIYWVETFLVRKKIAVKKYIEKKISDK